MSRVLVIGAGIAGIAAAARLAKLGFQVIVVEKGRAPGGRVAVIERDGFHFDTGPTLFLMPAIFAETYAALGEDMAAHLDLVRIDPTYRVHFHDDTCLDLSSDLDTMRTRLEAFEPGAYQRYLRFLTEGGRHYHLSLEHFVGRNFRTLAEYFSLRNLPLLFQVKALVKHAANTGKYFHDPRLLAAFTFQCMYLGLSPYDAPATYSLLEYTELAEGVWFPRGGLYQVVRSLVGIAVKLGVQFRYNSPVACIDVEGKCARGVTLESGEYLPADVVIANADLPYVYQALLPDVGSAQRLMGKKFTSSALMFFWGIKGERPPQLLHHNVFLADHRYRESFDRIFRDRALPGEPSFYVCAATRSEPGFAPPDGDSLMVLVPVGHLDENRSQDWDSWKQQARQAVITRLEHLGIHNLKQRIVFESQWSPLDYQAELSLAKGAAFGLSHNFWQVGYLRPHNRHPRYQNLYFAGASTHPGTGLPIVLLSARLAVERILAEQGLATWRQPSPRPAMEQP